MQLPLRPDVNASRDAAVTSLVRAAISTGLRHLSYDYAGPAKKWPNDRDVELILRAPSSPLTTTNTATLAHIAVSFLAALVPFSASAALIDRSLKLSFNGAASISMPTLTLPLADFVGQGKPIPVVQGTSASGVTLEPHKLPTSVVLTSEMMRSSNSEAIVRQILLGDVGPSLDAAMFSTAAAVADVRPPGLLNGITALTPAAAGATKAETLVTDVATLVNAVAPVAGNSEVVLIAAPPQATSLKIYTAVGAPSLLPFPVFMSSTLPAKRVIAVASQALVTAISVPEINGSKHAAMLRRY
jgi:hypothetical protein